METNFTKNDLRTGDIVVTKREGNAILLGNRFKNDYQLNDCEGMANINSFKEDLTHNCDSDFDITKVYRIKDGYDYTLEEMIKDLPQGKVELVWKRKGEIDWNKVPQFTRVQVRDSNESDWKNRRFIRFDKGVTYPYVATPYDEFTYTGGANYGYQQIRVFDESEIKEEWYK